VVAQTAERLRSAERVRLIVLDVDGVLTDAGLFYSAQGEELKRFSARDGFAVKLAQSQGIEVGILSGRVAPPLQARLNDLGIRPELVIQGSQEKGTDIEALAARRGVPLDAVAFMGDDLPDLPALARVGLAACPADAAPEVRAACALVTSSRGGHGAVRELVELLLKARGAWDEIVGGWSRGSSSLALDDVSRDV
jgi:3-deoxy-D-manno-octulosonate 8-phosphate phosphatase (KDO 8-P phosphatase)